ncbi:type I-C CRISPR-associated protein Cas8c/Csd1 [Porphyromonas sp.]
MILKALYDYYQAMAKLGKVASPGMEWKAIPFVIVIDEDGTFRRVIDTRDKEHKQGREYLVAKAKERQGKNSYAIAQILWDHAGYVLGTPKDDSKKEQVMAPKQHEAFKLELTKLRELFPENKGFKAIELFYKKYEEKKEEERSDLFAEEVKDLSNIIPEDILLEIKKKVGANISFLLSTESNPNKLISSHEDIQSYQAGGAEEEGEDKGRCLVTGEEGIIARKHDGISLIGAPQANPKLISFQKSSGYDSYGKEQGLNAPISQTASDAIISGLNMLLGKDKNTNYRIGETTFVFWNTLQDYELLKVYQEATFTGLPFDSDFDDEEEEATSTSKKESAKKRDPEKETKVVIQALRSALGSKNAYIDQDHSDRFYILALAPNAKRVSVKLWMEGTVSEIVGNTLAHLDDMNIVSLKGLLDEEIPPLRPIYRIMKAIYTATDSTKWPRQVVQELLESIIKGLPYPPALQMACLERIHHDHTTKYPVTELRAALLKAYINRKHRKNPQIKQLTMALDKSNSNPAYLAGRLFALLERIQEKAIPGVKANITDRYFRTASATPGIIFGRLLQLSAFHLSKIKKEQGGLGYYFDRQIQEVLELLPGGQATFDKFFSPDQQSIFAVGYYHQKAYRDQKDENEATETEQETEN